MSTVTEGTFQADKASLYSKTWTPAGPVKAKVIFVHGFSEHINCYNEFFPRLTAHGIQVFSWDQRGWGQSVTKKSERGLTGPTSLVLADVAAFIQDKLPSEVPVFVVGHSMGGGEVLTLAADPHYEQLVAKVRGWVVECPLIGFSPEQQPSTVKVVVGRLVGRFLPTQQMMLIVPPEHLSRDPAIVESFRNDPLCHNTGTLEGLAGSLDRTLALSGGKVNLGKRVRSLLLAHGTGDKTCSYDASMKWLEEQKDVEDKTAKSYEGAYHQLHSDHCKEEFTRDLVEWILERCDGQESTPVESKL